jgi:hypothetical protein
MHGPSMIVQIIADLGDFPPIDSRRSDFGCPGDSWTVIRPRGGVIAFHDSHARRRPM